MIEVHELVERGKTKRVGPGAYSEYVGEMAFLDMLRLPVLTTFRLSVEGNQARLDHVALEQLHKGPSPLLLFIKTHKGIVAFDPVLKIHELSDLYDDLSSHKLLNESRGERAMKKLGGRIGKSVEVDGIRYTMALGYNGKTRCEEPRTLRVSYEEAKKKLENSRSGATYKGSDGSEYIKLPFGDIVNKQLYEILIKHFGK